MPIPGLATSKSLWFFHAIAASRQPIRSRESVEPSDSEKGRFVCTPYTPYPRPVSQATNAIISSLWFGGLMLEQRGPYSA